ncbi:multidrug ABC transporter ATP-binding protein [Candidatus Roizmanbacteria bacterium CG_4_10_14_3_um_filter_39_13]|uniref:Multidrug ABC transporter ATP-binding protein n=3 Tax=Candidatus Roizmaniibacteriota TaxID=1752723 RepID=A0A2M7EKR9_9BACT|nr:MAG: multidrug ABC transporter ATP-binding protein [Candidatus Roizmanbacteria bacterium CG03_land_8_20_14_0_80_39_12]PIV71171.1 MAG: multidrug ABC transporter ATP-binding protein [Candidatus Roizmanbacteria bacterium CG17_big_fil_post_rev_8_21_14_2_50_39_7]PIX68899.1 MAG: multidrug ABC transporter ATP-binding protein [Candidatus Roizmanbacteria bacterium CG_4_10_14_3_um_filter_39_13]
MIEVSHVYKQFGVKIAVSDLSFKAQIGDIIGFVGPNGAGKTTTMRLITGLLKPTEGKVKIFEKNPITERLSILPRLGYLPENNPLPADMTVMEYLTFIAGVKKETQLEKIVQELHIDDVYDKKIEQLSRGYRQRVGLAASLCGKPEILLLDEPTSGLDPIEQDVIKDLIQKLAKRRIVIFSTHILSEIEDIATRVLIINRGSLLFDGPKPKGKGSVETLFKKLIKKS